MISDPNKLITIRPKRFVRAAILVLIEALFIPACIAGVLHGDPITKIISLLCFVFFGLGGIAVLVAILRRDWSLALTYSGIEMNGTSMLSGSCFIRWEDIEEIDALNIGSMKMVGIRLSSYDHYVQSLDAEKAKSTRKNLSAVLSATKYFRFLDTPNTSDMAKKLDAWNGVDSTSAIMEANRKVSGYDVTFGSLHLDRSPEKLVELLRAMWNASKGKPA